MNEEPGLVMVLTLRSGTQLRSYVVDYKVTSDALTGEITGLTWEAHPDAASQLKAVQMEDIAAVATEELHVTIDR